MRHALLLTLFAALPASALGQSAGPARASVVFDRHGEIAATASGIADPSSRRSATPDDPVRVASISKLVVTVAVMRLVEQHRLDLDRPIGDYLGYPVRNPAFPGQKVTLRRLLSHTSSLRDHDDQYAIPLGQTLKSVLDDPASWDPLHGPQGDYFTYANVNFPVVGSIVERVTHERFDMAMRRLVLAPMKLDACYNWPTCSDAAIKRAVVLVQDGAVVKDDLRGRQPACPVFVHDGQNCDLGGYRPGGNGSLFAPQGGLRISARDLARIGRMLMNGGTIDGVRILSRRSVAAMTRPAWVWNGSNGDSEGGIYCRFGLSIHLLATPQQSCHDDPGLPKGDWLGHSGEAYGLRSGLWWDRKGKRGMAYYTTGLPADTPMGKSAFTAPEEADVARAVTLLQQAP
ncbi:serine hydrolase domain-containing protein [Sphingomonas jaspsi]|uniref:serine hydrolase domain-containing protein n=1 Tax=Sphingomonas jaspsi TaxID=392409 RepID=UPI0004AE9EE7|nr:serine hydrolase domain-containing protein [Sphingomonas jaspsi]